MAEKRMFTQKIIDSDAFLDMPLSAQALYFHLNMRADDDGFINNPKKIQRMISASEDDLKLLIAKRFVLCFESGVIVIKHWRMHNTLRKDRYNPTQYQDEYSLLTVKENNSYTDKLLPASAGTETEWQPNGNQLETERKHSIDKYSIDSDKFSIEENKEAKTIRHKYGEYKNVLLSDSDLEKLKSEFPSDYEIRIENLSSYIASTGKTYKNHLATIRNWARKENKSPKSTEKKYGNYPQRQYDDAAYKRMLNPEKPELVEDDDELLAEAEALRKELAKKYGTKGAV